MMLLTAFVLASFCATEVFAYARGFHPWLGQPLTHAGSWPIYMPLDIWQWAWQWGWQAPGAFRGAAWSFALVFGGLLGAMLCPRGQRRPQAQWATRRSL
jgi:hypothetical protein